jgi:ATP-binding cassette subfamily C (CFTR/MRP) protein 1
MQATDLTVITTTGSAVPEGWPRTGSIVFHSVIMRYAPHLPPALRGVSFDIKSGDKVGVVGRTGSGKSTLLLALYRMFNLDSGRILVDGVDVASLPLQQLRRGMAVIPQEPVVFSGTVRSNLDPFRECKHDEELWRVLRECSLEEKVGCCCCCCGGCCCCCCCCWCGRQLQAHDCEVPCAAWHAT